MWDQSFMKKEECAALILSTKIELKKQYILKFIYSEKAKILWNLRQIIGGDFAKFGVLEFARLKMSYLY